MRFATDVFIGAGIWGVVVLTPFYWLVDLTGRHYSPPVDYPQDLLLAIAFIAAWLATARARANGSESVRGPRS
jgi:hypothetical protein